jgi:acetyl esterase/lipase
MRAAQPPVPLSDAVLLGDHGLPGREHASVRVHRKRSIDAPRPAIFWMHGSGRVLGTNRIDDPRFGRWCPGLSCVGVSLDYALAPESPFLGPLEDCYQGLK